MSTHTITKHYSGDQDSVVPLLGSRTLVRELAHAMGLPVTVPYSTWFRKGQVIFFVLSPHFIAIIQISWFVCKHGSESNRSSLTMKICMYIWIQGWRLGDRVRQLFDLRNSEGCISHGAIRTARPSSRAISINYSRTKTTKHNKSTNWLIVPMNLWKRLKIEK